MTTFITHNGRPASLGLLHAEWTQLATKEHRASKVHL